MAVLIFATFSIGLVSLSRQGAASANAKLVPLTVHIVLGIAILLIVIVRYALRVMVFKPIRRVSQVPEKFTKKLPLLDQLSIYVHPLLYLFSALMAVLGIAIALPSNLFGMLLGSGAAPVQLPVDFYIYPARSWHGTLSLLLLLLIGQHVLVAIFHQFLKGENFLGRMWFIRK